MAVLETTSTDVVSGATSVAIGQFYSVSASGNPAYLVIDALDRNEYTAGSTGQVGSFCGNANTLALSSIGNDGRGCGIVFTWQAATKQYVNATYGNFTQLSFTSSGNAGDVTYISVFTTSSATLAQQDAGNAYALMQNDAAGYVGSVTIATQPAFSGTVPAAATPDGVAAAALSFVGDAWNVNGCWVLASTIAAEAGTSLPVQSTAIDLAGKPNGEWVVVYNGPVSATANWASLVTTGDIVAFAPASGGGHITTCVSGSGTTAMLVDNIEYVGAGGHISNAANDGSAADITIAAPHAAAQEFAGAAASSVVIYALDCPVISDKLASTSESGGTTLALSTAFGVSDPTNRAITKYQIYDSGNGGTLTLGGVAETADNAASSALTTTSLVGLAFDAASNGGTETLDVRAFNGLWWGDWQTETLSVSALVPVAPVLAVQTANQTWKQGTKVALTLPAKLFTDPQGGTLTYSAGSTAGAALPPWLAFNAATHTLAGAVPAGLENFAVVITAADSFGLSSSETFTVTVPAAAPVVAMHVAAQSWATGSAVNFTLPTGNFTDPQGQSLTCVATLANGTALPGWLSFSAASMSFTGTAPATTQSLSLKITATDTSGLSVSETVAASIVKASSGLLVAGDWSALSANAGLAPAAPVAPTPAWGVQPEPVTVPLAGFLPHHLLS